MQKKNKCNRINSKLLKIILVIILILPIIMTNVSFGEGGENSEDTTWQEDWVYELNTENKTIILKKYTGTETQYEIPNNAKIDNITYFVRVKEGLVKNTSIEKLTIHSSVLIDGSAEGFFMSNENLKEVSLSGGFFARQNSLDKMFQNCINLETVNINNTGFGNGSGSMIRTFEGCTSLKTVNMQGFNASVSDTDYMFKDCTSLEELKIQGITTLEAYSDIISGCTNLKSLYLYRINNVGTKAFQNCESLEKLTLEGCNIDKAAFLNNPNLKEITFVGTSNKIEDGAFYLEPAGYETAYNGYKAIPELGGRKPIYTVTLVKSDDSKIFDYPWGEDNRLVTDGETYTITFNPNGGNMEQTTMDYSAGDRMIEQEPEREEYRFYGWNTKKDGSGQFLFPNDQIKLSKDITLYAQWRRVVYTDEEQNEGWCGDDVKWKFDRTTSTLTIYKQGEGKGRMYNQVQREYTSITAPWKNKIYANIKIEEGVTYIGDYSFIESGEINSVEFPDSLKEIGDAAFIYLRIKTLSNLKDNVKIGANAFYTVFDENKITQNANGGKFSDGEIEKTTITNLENGIKTVRLEAPEKEGYVFIGWNTKQDGTGDYYDTYYSLKEPRDITLYAIWKKDKITITFHLDKDDDSNIITKEMYSGEYLTSGISTPTKPGYVFSEWNTDPLGNGIGYVRNTKFYADSDTDLYAIWTIPYKIVIHRNGNDDTSSDVFYTEDGQGNKIRIQRIKDNYRKEEAEGIEVSREYLEEYFGIEITPRQYAKLITLILTEPPYDIAGIMGAFDDPYEHYKSEAFMLGAYAYKFLDMLYATSTGMSYFGTSNDLRQEFIEDHCEEIANKYELHVLKVEGEPVVYITPREKVLVNIRKTNVNDEEIAGAEIQLLNEQGEIIKNWTSTEEVEIVELAEGTYTLKEINVPDDNVYVKSKDIVFLINEDLDIIIDDEIQKEIAVVNDYKEHSVVISKINSEKTEIAGATLEVTGRAIGENHDIEKITWVSEEGTSKILKLKPGTYTLHEEVTPDGYIKAEDIVFNVDLNGILTINQNTVEKIELINEVKPKEEEPKEEEPKEEEPKEEEPKEEEPKEEEPKEEEPKEEEPKEEEPKEEEPKEEEPKEEEPKEEEPKEEEPKEEEPKEEEPKEEEPKEEVEKNPQTSDITIYFVGILIIASLEVIIVSLYMEESKEQ